jgi:outer membrane lipoprotein-sorting protein
MPSGGRPALVFAICLALLTTGCLARRRVITRKGGSPGQQLASAGKAALLSRVEQTFRSIQTLSATVDMVPALGSAEKGKVTEYKDVRGYVLFRKPDDIRIIGLYPVVRNKAFDMVSDGEEFQLYVPAKNRFIVGEDDLIQPSKNKLENLRPRHFRDALLVQPVLKGESAFLENITDEESAVYVLHIVSRKNDGEIVPERSIYFHRIGLTLDRQIIFDENGNILTDARYRQWEPFDGISFPKQIEINRPRDEYGVVLNVVKLEINKPLTDSQFALEQPEGSVLQVLGKKPSGEAANGNGKD